MKGTDEQVVRDVREAIERVLAHAARVDADAFEVEAANGKVTLHGSVRSWTERDAALEAAWAAPGVTAVDDRAARRRPQRMRSTGR